MAEREASDSSSAVIGTYHSYLVRLWQQAPDAPWRASAQSVQNGQAVHFADIDALFQFLASQVSVSLSAQSSEAQLETE